MSELTTDVFSDIGRKVYRGTMQNEYLLDAIDTRLKEIETLLRNGDNNLALDYLIRLRAFTKQRTK